MNLIKYKQSFVHLYFGFAMYLWKDKSFLKSFLQQIPDISVEI